MKGKSCLSKLLKFLKEIRIDFSTIHKWQSVEPAITKANNLLVFNAIGFQYRYWNKDLLLQVYCVVVINAKSYTEWKQALVQAGRLAFDPQLPSYPYIRPNVF